MPQIKDGPEKLNGLLEAAYKHCRSRGGDEEKCSKVAWAAAKNAGWHKNAAGKWVLSHDE